MGSIQNLLLARAGRKVRKAMREVYPNLREDAPTFLSAPALDMVPTDALEGVTFGSPQARILAEAEGMTWMDFAHSEVGASGATGYKVEDVRTILAARGRREAPDD